MKKETGLRFAKMSKGQLHELTTIVNETLSTDFVPAKSFTAVDLWNIQRQGKTSMNRWKLVSFR